MIHQSGRVGSGVVPMSQLVFKINEEHRVRPQDQRLRTKPAYANDACNARAYDLFLFSKELLGYYLQILNIKAFNRIRKISHQIYLNKEVQHCHSYYKRKGK
jgi:hypothetical protein